MRRSSSQQVTASRVRFNDNDHRDAHAQQRMLVRLGLVMVSGDLICDATHYTQHTMIPENDTVTTSHIESKDIYYSEALRPSNKNESD